MTRISERSAQRFSLIMNYATHEPYDSNEPEIPFPEAMTSICNN